MRGPASWGRQEGGVFRCLSIRVGIMGKKKQCVEWYDFFFFLQDRSCMPNWAGHLVLISIRIATTPAHSLFSTQASLQHHHQYRNEKPEDPRFAPSTAIRCSVADRTGHHTHSTTTLGFSQVLDLLVSAEDGVRTAILPSAQHRPAVLSCSIELRLLCIMYSK